MILISKRPHFPWTPNDKQTRSAFNAHITPTFETPADPCNNTQKCRSIHRKPLFTPHRLPHRGRPSFTITAIHDLTRVAIGRLTDLAPGLAVAVLFSILVIEGLVSAGFTLDGLGMLPADLFAAPRSPPPPRLPDLK